MEQLAVKIKSALDDLSPESCVSLDQKLKSYALLKDFIELMIGPTD